MTRTENTTTPVSGNADSQPPPKKAQILDSLNKSMDIIRPSELPSSQKTLINKISIKLPIAPPFTVPVSLDSSSRKLFKELIPVELWNEQDVFEWIQRLGLDYNEDAKRLIDAKISGLALQNIDPELFNSLVPNDERRQRIMLAVKQHNKSVKVALAEKAIVTSRESREKTPA